MSATEKTIDSSHTPVADWPEYPHVRKPVLLLFCAYVLIWYLQIGSRITFLGTIRIEFLVASILIPLGFAEHSSSNVKVSSPLIPLVVLYFLLLLVMTVFSYDPETSWNVFFNRVIKFAFMAFFIVCFVKSPTGMRWFIAAFLLACLKMGQEGLLGQITGSLVWQNQGVMRLHGSTMMYRHPNSFSGMALGTLPFILYLYPVVNKWCKILLFLLLVLSLNIILHTGSRTGYVGFIGIALVWFFRSENKIKILVALSILLLIFIKFIPSQYVQRFESIYSSTSQHELHSTDYNNSALHGGDSSKVKRIQILKDAVEIFASHPFGIGVSAFPAIRYATFGRRQDTHNLYLEVATNLGVQGIVLFLSIIILVLRLNIKYRLILMKQLRKFDFFSAKERASNLLDAVPSHRSDILLLIAVCDSIILFVVLRLFLGLFGMDLYEIYWWFAIGLTMAVGNITGIAIGRGNFLLSLEN